MSIKTLHNTIRNTMRSISNPVFTSQSLTDQNKIWQYDLLFLLSEVNFFLAVIFIPSSKGRIQKSTKADGSLSIDFHWALVKLQMTQIITSMSKLKFIESACLQERWSRSKFSLISLYWVDHWWNSTLVKADLKETDLKQRAVQGSFNYLLWS